MTVCGFKIIRRQCNSFSFIAGRNRLSRLLKFYKCEGQQIMAVQIYEQTFDLRIFWISNF